MPHHTSHDELNRDVQKCQFSKSLQNHVIKKHGKLVTSTVTRPTWHPKVGVLGLFLSVSMLLFHFVIFLNTVDLEWSLKIGFLSVAHLWKIFKHLPFQEVQRLGGALGIQCVTRTRQVNQNNSLERLLTTKHTGHTGEGPNHPRETRQLKVLLGVSEASMS